MKDVFKKFNRYFTIKIVSYASIVLNLACVILGIIYLTIPIYSILWDIFGVVLLIAFFENILLIYLNSMRLNKTSPLGNKINLLCYGYLIFLIFAMLLLPLCNFLISVTYSNDIIDNLITGGIVVIFYFGVLVFGMLIAYLDFKNLDNRELWDLATKGNLSQSKKSLKFKKSLKIVLGIISVLTLGLEIFLAYSLLFGVWVIGIVIPEFALSMVFISLSTAVILLKIINRQKRVKLYKGIAIIGLVLSGIFIIPLLLTPYSMYSADKNFTETFGKDWHDEIDQIDPEVEEKYFLKSGFWASGYFLGIPPKECNYKKDVLFFDGSKSDYSQDKDIKLYFDVFWPKKDAKDLPGKKDGKYSVIIKIHGGGWRAGDKGVGDMMQVNKYFAAQGYVVFDVQYGMKEDSSALGNILKFITPQNVMGDFDVDDMIRHLGIFTQYLIEHHEKYDANLDSVFVSGGSAGGHLTCALALGIASGEYTDIFGENVTIKGMIPFYPANGHSGLDGKKEFENPEKYLVDKNSPPTLIYQGTHDGSCAPVSRNIKRAYDDVDQECCIIWLPMAGHADDLYFSGYYSTIFLYYIERFLFLCVNDEIT